MRSILPSVGAVALCLVAGSAFANSTGAIKRARLGATSCATGGCHGGGTSTPTVTLEGPTALTAGQTGTYALIITGGPGVKGGMNVATEGGGTLAAGSGSKVSEGELTHTLPKAFSNGSVRFDFSLVAPATNGTVKLYAAGNSVNGDNAATGDAHANATLDVAVTGGKDPSVPDESKDDGGCSTAAGAPAVLVAVFAALAARRRKKV
jgi:MYXO-CTERM domain-containing protein